MSFAGPLLLTYWFWFGAATLLVILDVVFGANFFLLWMGLLAAVVGGVVTAFPGLSWEYQIIIFAVGSMVSVAAWRFYLKTHAATTDRPTLNRRAEQYVGRSFVLSEAIINGRGKIEVDDSSWRVEGPELPLGTRVIVVGVDGVILKVEKREE
jgi:membrane protein implicated in regulation of membrane protease activity